MQITTVLPPSNNKFTRRFGWKLLLGWKRVYMSQFRNYSLLGLKEPPAVKYRVEIVCYRVRLLDNDNLHGGCKPLIDALKTNRLFWDDSPKYVDLTVRQEKVKGKENQRAEIRITPTEDQIR